MTVSIVATLVWEKLCNRKLSNEKYRNFKPNFKNKSFAKISISERPKKSPPNSTNFDHFRVAGKKLIMVAKLRNPTRK
jgi:hypothetical protein